MRAMVLSGVLLFMARVGFCADELFTFAGGTGGSNDGVGTNALIGVAGSFVQTSPTRIWFSDWYANSIRYINPYTKHTNSVVGSLTGSTGFVDGGATTARFQKPWGMTYFDTANIIYIADYDNHAVRAYDMTAGDHVGTVTTVAGDSAGSGYLDGVGTQARFFRPSDLAMSDDQSKLYVVDELTVREITLSSGQVTRVAGWSSSSTKDGVGTMAQFRQLFGVVATGDFLYAADVQSCVVRQIQISSKNVITFAGDRFNCLDSTSGVGTNAYFFQPHGVSLGANGDSSVLYVASKSAISKIVVSTVQVTRIAGAQDFSGYADGVALSGFLDNPQSIFTSASGRIYLGELNSRIRTFEFDAFTISPTFVSNPTSEPVTMSPVTMSPVTVSPLTVSPVTAFPSVNPVTISPQTLSPLTNSPLTNSPITNSPITNSPLTNSPITNSPLTSSPLTNSPITNSPNTNSPITNSPLTSQPATVHPVSLQPTTCSPSMNPVTNMPSTAQPNTQHPATIHPTSKSPSTNSPVTSSPISCHPTTAHPASSHPATSAPVTFNPVTASPASSHPATLHPVSSHPATSSPLTAIPVTLSPTSSHPASLHPSSHPTTSSPVTSNPVTASPASSHPATLHPVSSHPATSSPLTAIPVTLSPASSHPASLHPSSHPATNSPVTSNPVTASPASSHPATLHPGSSHPATSSPLTAIPVTLSPASSHPASLHPSSHPATTSPVTSNPVTASPASSHPATLNPVSFHPATNSPGTVSPFTASPGSSHPVSLHPSSHPATASPVTSSPVTVSPLSAHPGTAHPGSSHPATSSPGTASPVTVSPVSSHPGSLHPSSHPATTSPVTSSPVTMSPVSSHPTTAHPGSTHPATTSPGTPGPLTSSPLSSFPITSHPGSSHPASSSPQTLSPLTLSPTSYHPATAQPGSMHPATISPFTSNPLTNSPFTCDPTRAPVTSHPGSTQPTNGPTQLPTSDPSVGPSAYAAPPVLALIAPQEVGTCGILRIDTSVQSIGTVNLSWFLNSHPITSTLQGALILSYSDLQAQAALSGIGSLNDGSVLNFTAKAFDQATGLTSSIEQAIVTHRGVMQPSLILSGPSSSESVRPSEPLRLFLTVQHASCLSITSSDLVSLSLQYTWEIIAGGSSLGLSLKNSPEIIVPSASLIPSQTHQVVISLSGISSLYPGLSTVQTSLTLNVGDEPVVPIISTGDAASVPLGRELVLDGSKSHDPAKLSGATRSFSWTCISLLPSPTSCTSSLTPSPTGETALLSASSLSSGALLTISLTFTVSANLGGSIGLITRSSTTSTNLTTVADAPLVSLLHVTSSTVSSPGRLSAGSALRLSSTVTPEPSSSLGPSDLIYSWSDTSGLLDGLSASGRLSSLGAPVLVIAGGSLTPGVTYSFTVSVTDPETGGSSQTSVSVEILIAPSVTSVDFSPSAGDVRETVFKLAAYATVSDLSQAPLNYQFLVRKVGETETAVGNAHWKNTKDITLDQLGTFQVGVEVRDSFGSMAQLWASGTMYVQPTDAFQDPCTALNTTNWYIIGLLREAGYSTSSEDPCIGNALLFHLDLLASLKAHSTILEASNYILSFIGSFPTNISTPCMSCTSHQSYPSYESNLFSKLISLLQPPSNSSAYASQTAHTIKILTASPLTTNTTVTSQSALVSNLLARSIDLSPTSTTGSRTSSLIASALSFLALARDPRADELTRELLVGVSTDMIPGEDPAVLTTSAFDAHVQALVTTPKASTTSSGVNVTVPRGVAANHSDARLLIVSWEPGLPVDAPMANNQGGESLVSNVEDVTLTDSNGNNIAIPDGESIRIAIPLKEGEDVNGDMRCVYIQRSEGTWSEDGCSLEVEGPGVACVCTHLTEFAVMRQVKNGQRLPESLRMTYVCGAAVAWMIALTAGIQSYRLWSIKAHRGWIAIAHYLLTCQGLSRGLSSLMFSGVFRPLSLSNSNGALIVVVSALPYTFSFWTASLIAFQWMASAFNPRLRTNNFHENRTKYYVSNAVVVVIMWAFFFSFWMLDFQAISYIGPAVMAFVCVVLVFLYLIGGLSISRQLRKSFSTMKVSRDSLKVRKQINHSNEVRIKVFANSACFFALSVVWILSGVFRDDMSVLEVIVPLFLFIDAFDACLILFMYANGIRHSVRKRSLSGGSNNRSHSSRLSSRRITTQRSSGYRPRRPYARQDSNTVRPDSRRDLYRLPKSPKKSRIGLHVDADISDLASNPSLGFERRSETKYQHSMTKTIPNQNSRVKIRLTPTNSETHDSRSRTHPVAISANANAGIAGSSAFTGSSNNADVDTDPESDLMVSPAGAQRSVSIPVQALGSLSSRRKVNLGDILDI